MTDSVLVALIVAIPPLVTSMGSLILGIKNRQGIHAMQISVDGKLSKFMELTKDLSFAQGRREGMEFTPPPQGPMVVKVDDSAKPVDVKMEEPKK